MKENYKIKNSGDVKILTFVRTIVLVVVALSLGSCKKYLDIKKTGALKFIETATDCQLLLDNYGAMNTNYPSDGQASSDDYYLSSAAFPGEIDQGKQNVYTWNANAIHMDETWGSIYHTVYYANLVLDALTKDKVKGSADAATINNLKGSALFYRAYALWNIAQLYAKPYGSTADQDPGIPARTSPDLSDVFGRGTVKETYNRITQDLQEAIGLLNLYNVPTPITPLITNPAGLASRPNKAAAYAMLARVYLSMEDYAQALTNANASLQLYPKLIDYSMLDQSSGIPFSQFNTEVLFQSIMSGPSDARVNLLSPFDNSGNPQAVINTALYASYEVNDLRKTIFFKPNSDGTHWFSGNYDPNNTALFNGLTVDEMYLTRAECYARAGNIGSAMTDLNTLLVTRWKRNNDPEKTTTYVNQTAGSVDAALSKILDERRKELVMRGQRWTDLRRLNKDDKFKVNLSRPGTTYTLPANDLRYILLIPQDVINVTHMEQNPR